MVESWKNTREFGRLGENARKKVEESMKRKQTKQSNIYIMLDKLTERAEMFNPKKTQRMPFFEKNFRKRKEFLERQQF